MEVCGGIRVQALHGVAVIVVKKSVNVRVVVQAAGKGVERPVLLDEHNDVLDLALPGVIMVLYTCSLDNTGQSQKGSGKDRQLDTRHHDDRSRQMQNVR